MLLCGEKTNIRTTEMNISMHELESWADKQLLVWDEMSVAQLTLLSNLRLEKRIAYNQIIKNTSLLLSTKIQKSQN